MRYRSRQALRTFADFALGLLALGFAAWLGWRMGIRALDLPPTDPTQPAWPEGVPP